MEVRTRAAGVDSAALFQLEVALNKLGLEI